MRERPVTITRTCQYEESGRKCSRSFVDYSGNGKFCDKHKDAARIALRKKHNGQISMKAIAFGN